MISVPKEEIRIGGQYLIRSKADKLHPDFLYKCKVLSQTTYTIICEVVSAQKQPGQFDPPIPYRTAFTKRGINTDEVKFYVN